MAQNNEGGIHSADYQRRLVEGSGNVDPAGNFSIQVLKVALQEQYNITLPHISQESLKEQLNHKKSDITEFQGFICHKAAHWFAIRQIGGRFWNLNSTLPRPVPVSHFQLASEMTQWQNQGYTLFCVPSGLPSCGTKKGQSGAGGQWHKMSDLLRGKSTEKDPWEQLTGKGMRLDGSSARANSTMLAQEARIDALTEEEQLQMAYQQSLETAFSEPETKHAALERLPPPPPEPSAGVKDSARLQFRLPDGRRFVRRFNLTDSIQVVFAFVQQATDHTALELKCGYPPKALDMMSTESIGDAKIAGESIQARLL
jgi:Josephin/UBX domain